MASAVSFSAQSLVRAERAIRCSPFRLQLLQDLRTESVAIGAIADDAGIHQGYTRRPLAELTAENELLWLMAVGLLRREVDGQGPHRQLSPHPPRSPSTGSLGRGAGDRFTAPPS
jgi:hypothetical protein